MKGGIAIKMKGGKAVMLGLLAVAVAIFFHALSTRYQILITQTGLVTRIDGWTGQICFYMGPDSVDCTSPGE